jgi:hypothetical protein
MKILISIFSLLLFGTLNSQDNHTLPLHMMNDGNYSYLDWDTNLDHVMEEVPDHFKSILQAIQDKKPFMPSEGCNFSGEGVILQGKNVGDLQRADSQRTLDFKIIEYVCSHDDADSLMIQRQLDMRSLLKYFPHPDDAGKPVTLTRAQLYVIVYGTLPSPEMLSQTTEVQMRVTLRDCLRRIEERVFQDDTIVVKENTSRTDRFVKIVKAIQQGKPFIPAEGCSYSGNGIGINDQDMGEFQRNFVKSLEDSLMPAAAVIYACSHDDPDSIIVQRFLDVISLLAKFTAQDIDENVDIIINGPTLYTILHGTLPTREIHAKYCSDPQREEVLMQELRDTIDRVINKATSPQS